MNKIIYIAECKKCGAKYIKTENPPKERQCSCGNIITYKEVSNDKEGNIK